ncbi:hypothetical protein L204_105893 [Cryptococcus depauperatus]|nr:hypothetical protein L204_06164 [Cryptococcus depauperatus CBS 7855]
MCTPTWFVTGASNGLGLELVLHVLERGHKVIGAVHRKSKSASAVEKIEKAGGCIIELDMAESKASTTAEMEGVGQIDYLVNNAGYSILAACETITYVLLYTHSPSARQYRGAGRAQVWTWSSR